LKGILSKTIPKRIFEFKVKYKDIQQYQKNFYGFPKILGFKPYLDYFFVPQ